MAVECKISMKTTPKANQFLVMRLCNITAKFNVKLFKSNVLELIIDFC